MFQRGNIRGMPLDLVALTREQNLHKSTLYKAVYAVTCRAAARTPSESLLSESRSSTTVSIASRPPRAFARAALAAASAGTDVGSGGSRFS